MDLPPPVGISTKALLPSTRCFMIGSWPALNESNPKNSFSLPCNIAESGDIMLKYLDYKIKQYFPNTQNFLSAGDALS